jgi:hypothetical protein
MNTQVLVGINDLGMFDVDWVLDSTNSIHLMELLNVESKNISFARLDLSFLNSMSLDQALVETNKLIW